MTQEEKKKTPPDWNHGSETCGGNGWHADMVRFFPHPEGRRRRVTASFMSWVGVAPGAVHTHVSLALEDNPVWTGETWATLWDDPYAKERLPYNADSQGFVRPDRALRWAVRTMERRFPVAEGWEHVFPGSSWYEDEDGNEVEKPSRWDPASVTDDPAEDAAVVPCPVCGFAVGEHSPDDDESRRKRGEACEEGFFEPAESCRTLVDAGPVTGVVGEDVLVLEDMHPDNVTLLAGRRALLVERGGAAAHLAQVAREMGTLTVMLVPGAVTRFPRGTLVVIDPEMCTVEPGDWL